MPSVNGSDREDTPVDHESVGAQFAHLLSERTRENLRKRHAIRAAAHQQLQTEGFGEFDTPVLGRWVNEYRVGNISATTSTGEHLWLAQSPQVYKQMLIAGGYQRYYQFAHCFRQEVREPGTKDSLREFVQLDIEMETGDLEAVIAVTERLITRVCTAMDLPCPDAPFPRMQAREAVSRYGTDRPDLRTRPDEISMLLLVDFPLAERDDEGAIKLTRHPMALPRRTPDSPRDMLNIDTWTFDLVMNGMELASGGLRINDAALQRHVLTVAGIDLASFEDLLHVLEDCPPHGGLGLGLDRLCMQLLGADSVAEVTGFPFRFGYWSRSGNVAVS
ncbi:amino acid--tRNA ligase-related protein [Streptomyces sp. NPDC051219]|uniref:amino acid--tRNA ligase-related protein n=1 Tax=Streptomyces sp. NPDC051219 TaxID=3155283 RepID=UPI0034372E05